ncbi:MAG TPA: ThuA domain-containing protein [Flavipsychrobacter sp.]
MSTRFGTFDTNLKTVRMINSVRTLLLVLYFGVSVSAQDTIKVLHYTETTGFDHNTRQASRLFFERICDSLTFLTPYVWSLDHSDNSAVFDNLNSLQKYSVVIWSNTSGANGLTAMQRTNYEQYVNGGGNYLGIHAAGDTYRHSTSNGNNTGVWDFYAEYLAGCSVQENPNHTSANHKNTMTHTVAHPILNGIPSPWNKTEEYYYWQNGYINSTFTELLRVASTGPDSYDAARMMAHYKEHTWGSRSIYTALGHDISNFTSDTSFEQLLENALYWCASPTFPAEISSMDAHTLSVFPNPFTEAITIDAGVSGSYKLNVYDLLGQKVYSGKVEKNTTISLSHLKNGMYYLVLDSPNQLYTRKLLKIE